MKADIKDISSVAGGAALAVGLMAYFDQIGVLSAVVIFFLSVIAVIAFKKWQKFETDIKVVTTGIVGLGLVILLMILFGQTDTSKGVEILFLGVLVLVTMWYAAHTKRMANEMKKQAEDNAQLASATKKLADSTAEVASATNEQAEKTAEMAIGIGTQADATIEMAKATKAQADGTADISRFTKEQAEEMRLQRLAAKPFVVPDIEIKPHTELLVDEGNLTPHVVFPISITNVGKEAAIELEVSLKLPEEVNTVENAKYDFNSEKLPLLMQNAIWKHEFFYFIYEDKPKESLIETHPPEGLYELKVSFKSPSSDSNTPPSEITLPFNLSWPHRGVWWSIRIERRKLIYNFADNL